MQWELYHPLYLYFVFPALIRGNRCSSPLKLKKAIDHILYALKVLHAFKQLSHSIKLVTQDEKTTLNHVILSQYTTDSSHYCDGNKIVSIRAVLA